ncbi:hypothetical protein QQ045_007797 [Rhodiola kirilowii]
MCGWVGLVKLASRAGNDAAEKQRAEEVVEVALKGLKIGLVKVMKAADCVRLKTMKGVLDICLTPNSKQCVESSWLMLSCCRFSSANVGIVVAGIRLRRPAVV